MTRTFHDTFDGLGITVLERGWLSSNSTVIQAAGEAWVIDTGYGSHAEQTVKLVEHVLANSPLTGVLNTHLHSDHCGGNAALAARYPGLHVGIPPGQAHSVTNWDPVALTYQPTGQHCSRFEHTMLLEPCSRVRLGASEWEVIGAPGHDPHAVLLYQRDAQVLIAGDALWENGFGVVFPELEGTDAFDDVRATLAVIETLDPKIVIPGHGRPFIDVRSSLYRAEKRLQQFVSQPEKHAEYAAKVLVKFHLLEHQRVHEATLRDWYAATPYFALVQRRYPLIDLSLDTLLTRLTAANAMSRDGEWLIDL